MKLWASGGAALRVSELRAQGQVFLLALINLVLECVKAFHGGASCHGRIVVRSIARAAMHCGATRVHMCANCAPTGALHPFFSLIMGYVLGIKVMGGSVGCSWLSPPLTKAGHLCRANFA